MYCLAVWKKIALSSFIFGVLYGAVNWLARFQEIFAFEISLLVVILIGYGGNLLAALGRAVYNGLVTEATVWARLRNLVIDWAAWTIPTAVILLHIVIATNVMPSPWDSVASGFRGAAYFATFIGSGFNTITLILGSEQEAINLLTRLKEIGTKGRSALFKKDEDKKGGS